MEFDWDDAKCETNLAKHMIDFRDAITIWKGNVVDPAASRQEGGELRRLALGMVGGEQLIIAVVYTDRGSVRRIISARRARRNERENYQSVFGRGR